VPENDEGEGQRHEEATGIGRYEWWPDEDRIAWSAGMLALYGLDHPPRAEHGFIDRVHPDDRVRLEARHDSYLSGRATRYQQQFRIVRPDGTIRHILDRGRIERDASGKARVLRGSNVDITNVELPAPPSRPVSEDERMRRASELALFGVHDYEPVTERLHWSEGLHRLLGTTPGTEPSFAEVAATLCEEDRDRVLAEMETVIRRVGEYQLKYRINRPDGTLRWVLDRGAAIGPIDPVTGKVARVTGTLIDITDMEVAEEALRRMRDAFASLIANSPFGCYIVNADFRLAVVSRGALPAFGPDRQLIGRDLGEVLRDLWGDAAEPYIARFRHTLETGEPHHAKWTVEERANRDATEAYEWSLERFDGFDGRPAVVCHFYDHTDEAEEGRRLENLMRESQHRTKNLLSLVQALARFTEADSLEEFHERFGDRIRALGATQTLTPTAAPGKVDLGELIRTQIDHLQSESGRFTCNGPEVTVSAANGQLLGMAIHELATNAIKHGALSVAGGRVDIDWRIEAEDGSDRLVLTWRERGGPEVRPPEHHGFGEQLTTTIIGGSLGARVDLDFAASGLAWTLDCPCTALLGKRAPSRTTAAAREESQSAAAPPPRLRPCVLVVEDDPLLAGDVARALRKRDHLVLGPARDVATALRLVEEEAPDFVILDTFLGTETSEPVARRLADKQIPFLITSGFDRSDLPRALASCPFLSKPFHMPSLLLEIERTLAREEPVTVDCVD
jgi:two-component sensor histidine kinase